MKIIHSKDIVESPVSHDDLIFKKVFISKGEIPKLMQFSSATLESGQSVEKHVHSSMFEVFYIQKGKFVFVVNDRKVVLKQGDCITIEQGEFHSLSNSFKEEVTLLYFGVATD